MSRTLCLSLLVVFLSASTARAQLAVIDPANLAQAILIAERTWKHYDELRREFETVRRMAQGLGDMERFRTPAVQLTEHDPLVLIETRELAWHRAKYRAERCLCAPADPVLVSLRTLQWFLWQRLQTAMLNEVPA
jgi:hypothetical protein